MRKAFHRDRLLLLIGLMSALYGAYFVGGGGWLLALGGTAFYLIFGLGMAVAGGFALEATR